MKEQMLIVIGEDRRIAKTDQLEEVTDLMLEGWLVVQMTAQPIAMTSHYGEVKFGSVIFLLERTKLSK